MAVKDVLNYYKECESQYEEFKNELNDFKTLCAQSMISPEVVENAQKMFNIVEDNYKKLSYIIFLLNKPTKNEKYHRYKNQNKKLLSKSITKNEVINQNAKSIQELQHIKENIE